MNKPPSLPINETEIILAHLLKKSREFIIAHPEIKLTSIQQKKYNGLIERRKKGEPIPYILGRKEFWNLNFLIDKNVLIPRPETELMVEKALETTKQSLQKKQAILDIGTGSGCIIISFIKTIFNEISAAERKNLHFFAIDISNKALKIAQKNAEIHQIKEQIQFINSNLLTFIFKKKKLFNQIQRFDRLVILANLPYLSPKLYQTVPLSVKKYEPKIALFSPHSGLGHYIQLIKQIDQIKKINPKQKISALIEISPEQKKLIEKEIKKNLPKTNITFYRDLAQRWRVAEFET